MMDSPLSLSDHCGSRGGFFCPERETGSFDESACHTLQDCTVTLNMNALFEDVALVDFGEVSAIELEVSTEAFAFAGLELFASGDFFNTGSLSAGTDKLGVAITRAGATTVPVPGTLALLGVGSRRG